MRESRPPGSVRGAPGNGRPYRDFTLFQLSGPLLLPLLPRGLEFPICGALLLVALPACRLLSERSLGGDVDRDSTVLDGDCANAGKPASSTAWWRLMWAVPAIVWSTVLFALFDALVLGLLPLYGRAHGLAESDALLSASVVLAGDTALEWVVGSLADRYGRLRIHVFCAVLLLLGAGLLPLAIATVAWWPLLFVIGGGAGGIYVLSQMGSGERFTGRPLLQLTALLGAAWGAASSAGPLLTGLLMDVSIDWALPGVLLACTAVLLLAIAREEYLSTRNK